METNLSANPTVKEIDDMLETPATVVKSDQLQLWLRGLGANARVIAEIDIE